MLSEIWTKITTFAYTTRVVQHTDATEVVSFVDTCATIQTWSVGALIIIWKQKKVKLHERRYCLVVSISLWREYALRRPSIRYLQWKAKFHREALEIFQFGFARYTKYNNLNIGNLAENSVVPLSRRTYDSCFSRLLGNAVNLFFWEVTCSFSSRKNDGRHSIRANRNQISKQTQVIAERNSRFRKNIFPLAAVAVTVLFVQGP